jgi:hypothetical protein
MLDGYSSIETCAQTSAESSAQRARWFLPLMISAKLRKLLSVPPNPPTLASKVVSSDYWRRRRGLHARNDANCTLSWAQDVATERPLTIFTEVIA